jgi:uncharacterized protein (TIGR02145 family)
MKKGTKLFIYPFIVLGFVLALSNSCKKEDTKMDTVITWANPADITYGTLLSATQLNATADQPGTFIYTPPAGTKLNEGANQDLKVDFTPTDTINYNTASNMVIINITAPITVTDIDGNVYKTVTIGTQVWMAENLKTTKYRNGDTIPNITGDTKWRLLSTEAYCDYENTPGNSAIYGKLYNWYAIVDSRYIAPIGWHVPTDAEWTTLENYVADNYGTYGSVAKALASTTNWALSSVAGTPGAAPKNNNSAGFTALPGGYRVSSGLFYNVGEYGGWWSSSEGSTLIAYCRYLHYIDSFLLRSYNGKECGFSVRCLKD